MKKQLYILIFLIVSFNASSQDTRVFNTFHTTRVISSHSTETLWKNELDFRVGHRFGDIAGTNGGPSTMFGIDNSSDIAVGFEYGVTNLFNIGLTRYKGAGPYRQLFEGYAKYKFIQQKTDKSPVSLVGVAKINATAMPASLDSTSPTSFTDFTSRISYSYQLLIARKFSERFSLQLMPTFVHRNYVAFYDNNQTAALGAGFRLQLTKMIGVIGEYHFVFNKPETTNHPPVFDPFGFAVEFNTGGHIFQLNITNSRGFGEAQYIPSTFSDASAGQVRFGFTISRIFKL